MTCCSLMAAEATPCMGALVVLRLRNTRRCRLSLLHPPPHPHLPPSPFLQQPHVLQRSRVRPSRHPSHPAALELVPAPMRRKMTAMTWCSFKKKKRLLDIACLGRSP